MSYQVLVVEDQPDIAELIKINLEQLDINCEIEQDGKQALKRALNKQYDVVILDVMLPSLSGLDICKSLRFEKPEQSIIMLTSKNSELDRVLGLELGADDYMTKPFSILELQARVKSQLRKVDLLNNIEKPKNINEPETLVFDTLTINIKHHQVIRDEIKIELTNLEFDLLLFLANSPGEVFSRTQLLDNVWGYQHAGYEHTVNSHINRLRNKIEINANEPKFIQTVWGVGYKFELKT
ncbi:MAG: response regulator transcription factor [Saccharospirillaceae bacterium]|nr:response regulator transcription factor [Pseudomonadales bacterium]NRB78812.1 response regulator transcription factor [Saccharospirillaceae bacterium]